jgi:hypothetical protein
MQPTTRFHNGITNAILQETNFVFHNPIAFHPTNGVFNADSDGGYTTSGRLLRRSEFPATRGFLRLDDRNARQVKSLEALILIQATAGWQGIACQLCHALIRGLSFTGMAQEAHLTGLVDHEEVFERVTLLLATVIFLLVLGIFRAVDGSFGPIMKKRGVVDPASVRFAASSIATEYSSSEKSIQVSPSLLPISQPRSRPCRCDIGHLIVTRCTECCMQNLIFEG